MYCKFYGGPMDGWEHYCPRARVGEQWLVVCETDPQQILVGYDEAPEVPPRDYVIPIARYRMVVSGRMEYAGMR